MTLTVIPLSAGAAPSGGSTRVAVTGDVDAGKAEQLRLAILEAVGTAAAQLEVDLARVTSMDPSGAAAMADAFLALQPSGPGLVLCNVPRQVRRILELTDIGPPLEVRR